MKIEIGLLASFMWAAPIVGQPSTQAAAPIICVSSQLVVPDVLVKNKKTGAPIDKLGKKDFLVEEDGQPQQITSVQPRCVAAIGGFSVRPDGHGAAGFEAARRQSDVVVAALIERSAATDAVIVAADVTPFALIGGARVGNIDLYAEITGDPVLKTNKTEVAAGLGELKSNVVVRTRRGYYREGE